MSAIRLTDGPDAGAVWHYGEPFREQRLLAAGRAAVDLRHRPVFALSGPDRLAWLDSIALATPPARGGPFHVFVPDDRGRTFLWFAGREDGGRVWAHTEPGHLATVLARLKGLVGTARVELSATPGHVVVRRAGSSVPEVVPASVAEAALGDVRAGLWAAEALRVAAGRRRPFLDDPPGEGDVDQAERDGADGVGARPWRLWFLHLDGSGDVVPHRGAPVVGGNGPIGQLASVARHYELGPIGLAWLEGDLSAGTELRVDGVAAAASAPVPASAFRDGCG